MVLFIGQKRANLMLMTNRFCGRAALCLLLPPHSSRYANPRKHGSVNWARPQNLWVINIRLARFCPINSTVMGLFYLDLFRTIYSRSFFRQRRIFRLKRIRKGGACGMTDKNYHHGDPCFAKALRRAGTEER